MNTALVFGFLTHENKMSWDCGYVKSSCKIEASGLAGPSLSTTRQVMKPSCLKHAVTPAAPQKISKMIALSKLMASTSAWVCETVDSICHSVAGISALCTSQNR